MAKQPETIKLTVDETQIENFRRIFKEGIEQLQGAIDNLKLEIDRANKAIAEFQKLFDAQKREAKRSSFRDNR